MILRRAVYRLTSVDSAEDFNYHFTADHRKAFEKRSRRIGSLDGYGCSGDNVSHVPFFCHVLEGNAGFSVAVCNRGRDRRCAAVLRE